MATEKTLKVRAIRPTEGVWIAAGATFREGTMRTWRVRRKPPQKRKAAR